MHVTNHQDALDSNQVQMLIESLWPESRPIATVRFHSENHQVYRIEGHSLDVVLKIQGKGDFRANHIQCEVETISNLSGKVNVPEVLLHGHEPRPYVVFPFYGASKAKSGQREYDYATIDHIKRLSEIEPVDSIRSNAAKRSRVKRLQDKLDKCASDQRFISWQNSIYDLSKGINKLVNADTVIIGQPQPGQIILTESSYVVIDWSEGLGLCMLERQIADLTFYTAIESCKLGIDRANLFADKLGSLGNIDINDICQYWLIKCFVVAKWLAQQKHSDEPIAEYMSHYKTLRAGICDVGTPRSLLPVDQR